MTDFAKFNFKNRKDLQAKIGELGLDIAWSNNLSIFKENIKLDTCEIPNKLAIHPMEGLDANNQGAPGKLTTRRYLNFARGGAGLIWWEATSVVTEGKSNKNQLHLKEDNKSAFASLVNKVNNAAIDEYGRKPVNILQLNHSGRYSAPQNINEPIFLFHDPHSDDKAGIKKDMEPVGDTYLSELVDKYVQTSKIAQNAGFDGVDIKACHRYLLSEQLAAYNRDGQYGGSYKNRVKLLLTIIEEVKQNCPDLLIAVRLNVYDAIPYPYGWGVNNKDAAKPDLSEAKRLVEELENRGVEIFSITASDPRINPHIVRPYNNPVGKNEPPQEHPLQGCHRLFELTAKIKKELPESVVLGSGYSWLKEFFPFIAAGNLEERKADMVGVGRMAFAYSDFAKDMLTRQKLASDKVCVACSRCSELMIAGGPTGCVVREKTPYLRLYKEKVN